MEHQTLPRVWKFPLFNRVTLITLLFFVVALLVVGLYFSITDPSFGLTESERFGAAAVSVLLIGLWVSILLMPSTTLVVSSEGVLPTFLPRKYQTMIRWDEIRDIQVVEQNAGKFNVSTLAFYLTESRSFGPLFSGSKDALMGSLGSSLADGGIGSLYVPEVRLNEKVEVVRDTLLAIRNQQLHHA